MKTTITLLFIYFSSPGLEQEYVIETITRPTAEKAWEACHSREREIRPLISLPTHRWELECLEGRFHQFVN